MKIAVDMDDVLVDFSAYVLECIEREYGVVVDMEALTDWNDNPLKDLRIFAGGGSWWDWLRTRDWLWAKAPAVPGAIGGIQRLRDAGHVIHIVTTKPEWAEWVVWSWLGKWRPAVHGAIIVPHVEGAHNGLGLAKVDVTDADLLIDDGLHNVIPWRAAGRLAILFDRPWNRSVPAGRGRRLVRAKTWDQVVDLVNVVA